MSGIGTTPEYLNAPSYELHPLLRQFQESGKEVIQPTPYFRYVALISEREAQILGKGIALMEFSRVGGQHFTVDTALTFEFYTEARIKRAAEKRGRKFKIGDILILNSGEEIEIVGDGPVVVLVNTFLKDKSGESVKLEEL